MMTPMDATPIVRERLWRTANMSLSDQERDHLVKALMDARRAVKAAKGIRKIGRACQGSRSGQRRKGWTWGTRPGLVGR